ncbi:hypothetical protein [Vibrio fortis]|uniref:hypothetical protein n=1 Tax=Vibrio fortis TaxID=212667 RepID=UPI0038CDB8D7
MKSSVKFLTALYIISLPVMADAVLVNEHKPNTTTVTSETKESQMYISFDGNLDSLPIDVRAQFPSIIDTKEISSEETKVVISDENALWMFRTIFIQFERYQKINGEYIALEIPSDMDMVGISVEGTLSKNGAYSDVVVQTPESNELIEGSIKRMLELPNKELSIYHKKYELGNVYPFEATMDVPLHPEMKVSMVVDGTRKLVKIKDGTAFIESTASGDMEVKLDKLKMAINMTINSQFEYDLDRELVFSETTASVMSLSYPAYEGFVTSIATINSSVDRRRY